MNRSFNLLKEPWLPCIDQQNHRVNLNLVDAVLNAHQFRGIQGDFPIITGALYLFLIAFVMNILKPEDEEEWEQLWKKGHFAEDPVSHYVEQWNDRFDLFDPVHPFYQDPKIGEREKDVRNLKKGQKPVPKGMSGLIIHLASGNNATLFDHSVDNIEKEYSAAQAAQWLIALQAYSLGGMSSASIAKDRYYKDSPFSRGILFLSKGQNLFETVMLNLPSKNFSEFIGCMDDRPSWEREDPFTTERLVPDGMIDFLTWQSRRIFLIPDKANGKLTISSLLVAPGYGLIETFKNPFYHNRIIKDEKTPSIKPMRFQEGRSLWRDSAAILNVKSSNDINTLPILWTDHLKTYNMGKELIQLDLYGMCTQPGQKKAYFYAHNSFTAPIEYIQNEDLLSNLQGGLTWAEQVRSNLYIAVRELARFIVTPMCDHDNVRTPSRDDTDPLMKHWNHKNVFWSRLETEFYTYLTRLPGDENAHVHWQEAIKTAARKTLAYAADQAGTAPAGLKARAKAERTLNYLMYKTFNPSEKE